MIKKRLLVLRFSAMGDVALLAPVIHSILEHNPEVHITIASRKQFQPFFQEHERFRFIGFDMKNHKGWGGIGRIVEQLNAFTYDYCLDLHDVLRTKVIRRRLRLSNVSPMVFDKGRSEKKKLTKRKNKNFNTLPHTIDRYFGPFKNLGLTTGLSTNASLNTKNWDAATLSSFLSSENITAKNKPWLAIAPFAAHTQKEWPFEKMKALVKELGTMPLQLFFFGGGAKEIEKLQELQTLAPSNACIVAGNLKLKEELQLMRLADAMLCMDSGNMHLAALVGTKTISIWGATHPAVGFSAVGNGHIQVQVSREELACRPCSAYGKEPCHRKDFACMNRIEVTQLKSAIDKLLFSKN